MVSSNFFATTAQVIPVLVLALILEPRIIDDAIEDIILLAQNERYATDRKWVWAANTMRRFIEWSFAVGIVSELLSLVALMFDRVPWILAAFVMFGVSLVGAQVALGLYSAMNGKFHSILCRLGPDCPREARRRFVEEYRKKWSGHNSVAGDTAIQDAS